MASTMPNDSLPREETDAKASSCLGWLVLFGLLGALATALLAAVLAAWSDRESQRRSDVLMMAQIEQLRRGEIHCLVQPDPGFINKLLADANCAANIDELYLGGDVSDERLGRLRELPNLKCVVLLFADNPDLFLERLQGMTTVEELILDHTWPLRCGVEFIGSLPNLKSLSLPVAKDKISDLDGVKNHGSIENLTLSRVGADSRLLPFLRSLPRLGNLTIEDAERDDKSFEKSLRESLPNCRCSVRSGR
jgi:hypothetical protein